MKNLETITAKYYKDGKGRKISVANGKINAIETVSYDGDLWLAPTLTDLQVNGYAKASYGNMKLTLGALKKSVSDLNRDGCGEFFPTLCTDKWENIIAKLKQLRAWREADPELKAAMVGWHIEGPFMSPISGYCGAHSKELMVSPTPEHLNLLRKEAGNDPVLITMAPEQPGVIEIIPLAVSLGFTVSLGHTNASNEELAAAIKAGAKSFTHLGNGCPQELDRHNNIIWRGIEATALHVGLIPDSIHVSPMLFRIMHRAMDTARFWYTTDAVHPAGALPGIFRSEGGELVVGPDQVVRKPGATNFAGSALRPLEGIFRAADMLGCSWRDVWDYYSIQPRKMVGLDPNQLAIGKPASFCVYDGSRKDNPEITTYIGGKRKSTLPAQGWMKSAGITE